MLPIAFKEWAVVCRALASGQQSLILRKGGIAETAGEFRPEHNEFLLYPTFFHEHRSGVKPASQSTFDQVDQDKPEAGTIRFTELVRVTDVRRVTELDAVLALDSLHIWTPEIVQQRFHYRTPGLYVLTVRVFRLPSAVIHPERPEYAGCKTWVELDTPVAIDGAVPVLSNEAFAELRARINA